MGFFIFLTSRLLEAGGEVAETRSVGQEVQTPSSIPLNWIPGGSEVGTSERSVRVCVTITKSRWVKASLALPQNRVKFLLGHQNKY